MGKIRIRLTRIKNGLRREALRSRNNENENMTNTKRTVTINDLCEKERPGKENLEVVALNKGKENVMNSAVNKKPVFHVKETNCEADFHQKINQAEPETQVKLKEGKLEENKEKLECALDCKETPKVPVPHESTNNSFLKEPEVSILCDSPKRLKTIEPEEPKESGDDLCKVREETNLSLHGDKSTRPEEGKLKQIIANPLPKTITPTPDTNINKAMESENMRLQNTIDNARAIVTDAIDKLNNFNRLDINFKVNLIFERYAECLKRMETLKEEHKAANEELIINCNSKIEQIQTECNLNLENTIAKYNAEVTSIKAEREATVSELTSQLEEACKNVESLTKITSVLETDLTAKEETIKELTNQLTDKTGDIEDLKLEIIGLNKQNEINCDNLEFYRNENAALIKHHDKITASKAKYVIGLNELQKVIERVDIAGLRNRINEINRTQETTIKELTSENIKIKKEFEKSSGDFTKEIETYANKLTDLERVQSIATEKLNKEIGLLESNLSELSKENNALQLNKEKIESAQNELKEDLKIKTEYVTELEKALTKLQESNKYYQSQLIKSDKLIQDVKANKIIIDFPAEMEMIKKKHEREISLLKKRIDDYQNNQ